MNAVAVLPHDRVARVDASQVLRYEQPIAGDGLQLDGRGGSERRAQWQQQLIQRSVRVPTAIQLISGRCLAVWHAMRQPKLQHRFELLLERDGGCAADVTSRILGAALGVAHKRGGQGANGRHRGGRGTLIVRRVLGALRSVDGSSRTGPAPYVSFEKEWRSS